ncbi:MAG: hypothetical protein CM1200mP18_19930 [Gammaproteobacteria bacterium]|nr:MAG: hypothetical protein CM1200mP18_19930 [Gammaproteobacteria bacterium]
MAPYGGREGLWGPIPTRWLSRGVRPVWWCGLATSTSAQGKLLPLLKQGASPPGENFGRADAEY